MEKHEIYYRYINDVFILANTVANPYQNKECIYNICINNVFIVFT